MQPNNVMYYYSYFIPINALFGNSQNQNFYQLGRSSHYKLLSNSHNGPFLTLKNQTFNDSEAIGFDAKSHSLKL